MGAFKLGRMTLASVFKKPETIMYPTVVPEPPAGLKGQIVCDVEKCILCSMCQKSCTCDCIRVDKASRVWAINHLQCVQCGYCITCCPKKCLIMDPHYSPVTTMKAEHVFEVPEQEKKAKPAEANE